VIRAWCYGHDMDPPDEIDVDAVAERLDPKSGIIWVDTDDPKDPALNALLDGLGVSEFAQEDLAKAGQRTKLEHYGDHFHVAVYDCVLVDLQIKAREIDIVFGNGWVITVHQPPEDGDPGAVPVDEVERRFAVQRMHLRRAEVGVLLWAMLDVIVDRYFVVTDEIDDELDAAEDAVVASAQETPPPHDESSVRVFRLAKALIRFRRAAVPLRDVTAEIVRREVPCIDELSLVHFQDLADHTIRVSEYIESQRDVLTGLRDAELAASSNRLSRSQQKIAAWGAIFIVATLITGILGMNFRNAPELDWELGFLVIFGVMALIGIPMFWYFKKRDWI
jgi:magnesium transporter